MKNLIITIAVFSVLVLIGCQENAITDPVRDSELQKNDGPPVNQGTMSLQRILTDPNPVMNSYYIINGEIGYQYTLQILEPMPPNPQYVISLDLSVNADFTYWCSVCEPEPNDRRVGNISREINEIIYLYGESNHVLIKTFRIQGRDDGMVLMCKFLVTPNGIELGEMWLEIHNYSSTTDDQN